jgi:FixJ family two-component response regulator
MFWSIESDTSANRVVDDEEAVRRALRRLLNSAGYEVDVYENGNDLLGALGEKRPACVVPDLHMPRIDGFAVLDTLLGQEPKVPVLVMTGDDSPDARKRVGVMGVAGYFRKPVDGQLLINAIQDAVGRG